MQINYAFASTPSAIYIYHPKTTYLTLLLWLRFQPLGKAHYQTPLAAGHDKPRQNQP